MHGEPNFANDLYRGAAESYDRFRLPYPQDLTEDLLNRVRPSRRGRLLDLACGTGQLAFALEGAFAETWAVDQEPDMIRVVEAKLAGHRHRIRALASTAEELSAEAGSFELITIGNAFHRLRRDQVARRAFEWLGPGCHLALCWSSSPWTGRAGWQVVLNAVLDQWRDKLGARDRIPHGWEDAHRSRPDHVILSSAGFESVGRYEFQVEHYWTVTELTGFVYSTSFLATPAFGDQAPAFEADLTRRLEPHLRGGILADQVSFAYDLVRRPAG